MRWKLATLADRKPSRIHAEAKLSTGMIDRPDRVLGGCCRRGLPTFALEPVQQTPSAPEEVSMSKPMLYVMQILAAGGATAAVALESTASAEEPPYGHRQA